MNFFKKIYTKLKPQSVWARPKMTLTFRAEVMPGKNREERTFRVQSVLGNGRVTLDDFSGEHRQSEFEPVKLNRISS